MISYDMTMTDYLKYPAYNASKLKLMLQTPLDFKAGCEVESNETNSTILGTATHALLLEPNEFDSRYALQEENFGNKTLKPNKDRWAAFKTLHKDKIILPKKESDFLIKLKSKKNPVLRLLVASGKTEVTAIIDEESFARKARADLIVDDTIYDLKTTVNGLDDSSIYRTIKNYKYDFSAAHYMSVMNKAFDGRFKKYCWIFQDTGSAALQYRIIKCPDTMLDRASFKYENIMNELTECLQNDTWTGYPKTETELEIPNWAQELK